jgi:hypothetical protein
LIDRLASADDLVEFWRELLDPFGALRKCDAAEVGAERGATGCGRYQVFGGA